ncbi:MAG: cysteine desulfurase, partial [Saprospiraceae bacterium]|nr:cysteine desulfurase [Saprospiraceae bacterium]
MFPEVIDVMVAAMHDYYGNPSSIHAQGRKAKAAVEVARKKIATLLGCSVGEIFITSGGSEANNTALKGAVLDLGLRTIITTKIEHPCVLRSIEHLAQIVPLDIHYLDTDATGRVNKDHLKEILSRNPKGSIVSIMHANNEVGTMNNIEELGLICTEYGALFHSDTVQTIGHFDFPLAETHLHFASASAHKFHGPKGIGLLYLKGAQIKPLIDGGGQERNIRAGTENVASIIGMAKALDLYFANMENYERKTRSIRDYAREEIQRNFPGVKINGDVDGASLYTVLSITFPGNSVSDLLVFNLDIEGISASGGSACSSGVQKVSHVLAALDPEDTGTTVRLSFSPLNDLSEIEKKKKKLKK